MKQVLQGVRVCEVGDAVAVRYFGRLFAALGAEVFHEAAVDDGVIGYAGLAGEAYGRWLDHGKSPDDGGPVDILVGGLEPGDLSAAEALQLSRGGTLVAMAWFDPTGPYGSWRGADEIVSALNGIAYSFGLAEGPPMLAQGHTPQLTAAVTAFNAALANLLRPPAERARRIDLNVLEASLCYAETAAITSQSTGAPSVRLGVNKFIPTYPCSPYLASDGWVGVTCLTPAQWNAFCGLLERPDLAADPRFATAYERLMLAEEVDTALATAFSARTQRQWVELGLAHRIPITAMFHPGDLPSVGHWRDRGAFASFGVPDVLAPTLPFRMSFDAVKAEPWAPRTRDGPLGGLRVVDFSMGWAGPLCARTLADLGADVVKIESEIHPDWWRGWEAGAVDIRTRETPLNFIDVNRNKRGVAFDLTQPDGLSNAKALVAQADVVVENFAAGVLVKLGLGPEVQRELRPGVINLSMPAFGNDGPLSGLRAYGSTVEQASGMPFVNGEADWAPAQQHIALGDPIAGLYAASAILAALYARHRLGGAYIDHAQVACLFQLAADAIIAEQVLGAHVPRGGHARQRLAFCAVVAAAGSEDWLAVAVRDELELAVMVDVMGGIGGEVLATWAATRSAAAGAQLLQARGLAAAPVTPPHGLTRDPQLAHVQYFQVMERAVVGPHLVGASPFRFDGERPLLRRPAPLLGEHTAEVLDELRRSDPAISSS